MKSMPDCQFTIRQRLKTVSSYVVAGCFCLAVGLIGNPTSAIGNDGITSDAVIHRAGLKVEWFTHSGVGPSNKLVDWDINVNENKSTTFFTIKAGKYQEKFSQNTISPFGRPYGIDGAEEYATVRVDVIKAEFANEGKPDMEVKIDRYTLPQTTIYSLTSNAIAKAIDGDTGKVKWSARVGDSRFPSIGIGSSDDLVAVVNGSTVYCLDAETGKIIWTKKCRFAPSAPPSVAEGKIYVPLLNGRLETFVEEEIEESEEEKRKKLQEKKDDTPTIDADDVTAEALLAAQPKNTYIRSYAYVSKGRGTARPLITDVAVAWPTSEGDLNVAAKYGKKAGIAYRLRAENAIVCSPVIKEGTLFVTSLDGFIYALNEERGTVDWQFSTGHSISQSPIVIGNYVFVINDKNEMYKFDAKTGFEAKGWETPMQNVERFVGASKKQMYVLDRWSNLKVVSQSTGSVSSSVPIEGVSNVLDNMENDRLYAASQRGMIYCIREIGSPIPHFHSNEFIAVEVEPQKQTPKTDKGQQAPVDTDLGDPFKSTSPADDPFASPNAKPAAADDSNPFATSKAGAGQPATEPDDDDPFK